MRDRVVTDVKLPPRELMVDEMGRMSDSWIDSLETANLHGLAGLKLDGCSSSIPHPGAAMAKLIFREVSSTGVLLRRDFWLGVLASAIVVVGFVLL